MDGAAGLYVHVERAKYLGLVMLPDRLKAVVGEKGAEVRASPKILELNTSALGHVQLPPYVIPTVQVADLFVISLFC